MPSPKFTKEMVKQVCEELKRITNFPMDDDHVDQVYRNLNAPKDAPAETTEEATGEATEEENA